MPSQIEQRYGVPLPIDVLWREIEARHGPVEVADLKQIYQKATQRYSRGSLLNKMRRIVDRWDRGERSYRVRPDKEERWRKAVADPQAYIDGEL